MLEVATWSKHTCGQAANLDFKGMKHQIQILLNKDTPEQHIKQGGVKGTPVTHP